jgi:AhpD family alkylhydroperoxidase
MPRLTGVSDRDAKLGTKIAFFFTKRHFKQMTGGQTAAMLEPLRMYAYVPRVLSAIGRLELAESKIDILSPRQRALAELKAATTVSCEYCIDLGSQIARSWGLTDEELLAVADYKNASCFSDVDKLILSYAAGISRTPVEVSDELFDALRTHFDNAQLVALTHIVTLGNLRGRFNLALGIGSSGFSDGRVCAVPDAARRWAPTRSWRHTFRRRGRSWARWPTGCWGRSTTPRMPCRRRGCG